MKAIVLQQNDGDKWRSIGMLEATPDGMVEYDDATKETAESEFYNPTVDRRVDCREPELFFQTIVEYTGNAYFRWLWVKNNEG